MTITEYLLFAISEECHEIGQGASKAARFGMAEIQPGQLDDNAYRIVTEVADLMAVVDLLSEQDAVFAKATESMKASLPSLIAAKREKFAKFLEYSKHQGVLQ